MTDVEGGDVPHADAYLELANRLEGEDRQEIWTAFGERMTELAKEKRDGHEVAGFALAVSPDLVGRDVYLGSIISVGYRQFGADSEALQRNAVARNADVYAVMNTDPSNPVEVVRQSVAAALRTAANGGRFSPCPR